MSVSFFDRTYREALSLTRETRDYFNEVEPDERDQAPSRVRLAMSCEGMRVTARLTQVVAWLLIQRAVMEGELTRAEAREQPYRLSGQDVCSHVDAQHEADFPERLRDLLARSLSLYQRIERLDAELDFAAIH